MAGLGLKDVPLPIGRALDFGFLCAEPVGRWDLVRVGDLTPSIPDVPCADVPWLTGLWGRRWGRGGLAVLAYLDPAPAMKRDQDAAVRRLHRDLPGMSSLRFALRAPSGRFRVIVRDGSERTDRTLRTVESAARAVSAGRAFF